MSRSDPPTKSSSDDVVRAAGAVVWRALPDGGVEVLLIHRPRYDDWSLPKGKRELGESDRGCAMREVAEETGLHGPLGAELPSISYTDQRGRPKVVRYWTMAAEGGEFMPNHEVDAVRWLGVDDAERLLSYPHDRTVLDAYRALA